MENFALPPGRMFPPQGEASQTITGLQTQTLSPSVSENPRREQSDRLPRTRDQGPRAWGLQHPVLINVLNGLRTTEGIL